MGALTSSEDTFRGLLECAPDAMVIVDHCGEIVLINAQTERLFGYRREELVGERVEVLVPDRYREHHRSEREEYSKAPHPRAMEAGLDLLVNARTAACSRSRSRSARLRTRAAP